MKNELRKAKKPFELPHGYIILLCVMLLVAALTWIIPAGEYDIVQNPESGIEEIDPSSFHFVERDDPVTFFGFFTAINAGIVKAMGIGSLILVMTGALAILDSTDALTAGVHRVIAHSKGKEFLIVASFFLLFLICGVVGMAENMMPFIPIVITLVMGLGYDRMLGFAVVVAGLEIGWTAGIVNIYTTGFSQQMIGLPIFSGLGYRTIATVVFFLIGVTYFWFYCKKIKADPSKSCCAEEYMNQRVGQNQVEMEEIPLTLKMKLGLLIFAVALIVQTYGCVKLEWSFNQMSAVFIISTIVTVLVCGINPSKACRIFTTGAADLLSVVFMMGFAQAITALMRQGKILDTIVYYLSGLLQNKGLLLTLLAIFFVVMVMNFFIISGEAKAVVLIPILSPLGKALGINQQVLVLAYQYAEGFTNDLYPTYGSLHAMLAMGKLNFGDWIRFSWKLWCMLLVAGFAFVLLAQVINLGPF